tara:strand:+ start:273 stop:563 length:291 start_codon:yes stop_codon:yes gene_type:complete
MRNRNDLGGSKIMQKENKKIGMKTPKVIMTKELTVNEDTSLILWRALDIYKRKLETYEEDWGNQHDDYLPTIFLLNQLDMDWDEKNVNPEWDKNTF